MVDAVNDLIEKSLKLINTQLGRDKVIFPIVDNSFNRPADLCNISLSSLFPSLLLRELPGLIPKID